MKILTLAFLFRGDKILLAMKKRGFGTSKWNGYGGKLLEGETQLDSIVREIKEEGDIEVQKEDCKELGQMDFYFDDKEDWNQRVIIYRVDKFSGDPKETEEMSPAWFNLDEIPYKDMWKGDDQWIKYVIENKNFSGKITFTDSGEKVIDCVIN